MEDLYELLEVAPTASAEVISAAINAQRRIWMQRQSAPTIERRQQAEQIIAQLAKAEKTLLDPAKRTLYDLQRPDSNQQWTPTPPAELPTPSPRPNHNEMPAPAADGSSPSQTGFSKPFLDYPWWAFALGAFCCWPIGIPLGVMKVWKSEIHRTWKILITVVAVMCVVYLVFYVE